MEELDDNNIDQDMIHMVMLGLTVEQVLQNSDADLWCETIISEVESLNSYRVFHQIEKGNGKIMPTKFMLMRKLNEKGKVKYYKAGLVAQGSFQWPGFDFDVESTHALTVDHTVHGLLLAIAVSVKLESWQYDVKMTYLKYDLDQPVMKSLLKVLTIGHDKNTCFSHSPIAGNSGQLV